MDIQELIKVFDDSLNPEGNEVITAETDFKNCEKWDSLSAFTVSETLYTKFNIKLRGIQIRKCTTIQDLCNLINEG